MARLRTKAHQVKNGHIARLKETKDVFSKLPVPVRRKSSSELATGYNQMIGIDQRLERLDNAIASEDHLAAANYPKLYDLLKADDANERDALAKYGAVMDRGMKENAVWCLFLTCPHQSKTPNTLNNRKSGNRGDWI